MLDYWCMKKVDFIFALLAGLGVAYLFSGLLNSLEGFNFNIKLCQIALFVILPLLSLFAIWLAQILGKRFLFIFQIAKFLLIGVLATLFHLLILNILMSAFGVNQGLGYTLFVALAFLITTIAKYWGNKLWAFESSGTAKVGKEMTHFFVITLISLALNVLIASFIVNKIGPQFGLSAVVWANVGSIIASIIVSLWNFFGYKFIVFKD